MVYRRWLAVLAWMIVIFYLSHEPAVDSSARSGVIVGWLTGVGFGNSAVESLSILVRKGAHLTLYLILSILTYRAWRVSHVEVERAFFLSFVITALFAASDEVHQVFIPGRSGEIFDVLIDCIGAVFGLILEYCLIKQRVDPHKKLL